MFPQLGTIFIVVCHCFRWSSNDALSIWYTHSDDENEKGPLARAVSKGGTLYVSVTYFSLLSVAIIGNQLTLCADSPVFVIVEVIGYPAKDRYHTFLCSWLWI